MAWLVNSSLAKNISGISENGTLNTKTFDHFISDSLTIDSALNQQEYNITNPSNQENDSTEISSQDTLSHPTIQSIEVYIDYLKLIGMAFPNEKKAEVGLKIVTGINLGLFLEAGYALKTPEDYIYNGSYEVNGYYGRLGLSYNYGFLPDVNFFAGFNYALSKYEDEATVIIESSLWDDYSEKYTRENLEAQWTEIIIGSESRWKSNFFLGFMFRFRIMIDHDNFSPIEVYTIPGYGRSFAKTVPSLNLFIKYRIGF